MRSQIDVAELDPKKVLNIDLGSQETKKSIRPKLALQWAKSGPIYVPWNGHIMVLCGRHADAVEVYQDWGRFSTEVPKEERFAMFDRFTDVRVLLQTDGAPHDRIRRLMMPAFAPKSVKRLELGVAAAVDKLLDDIEATGPAFDGVKDYAEHLIVEAMLTVMLDLAPEQKAVFLEMHRLIPLITYTEAGYTYPEVYVRAFANARKMIDDIVADRKRRPGDDLISDLIAARNGDDRLSDDEIFDQIFTLSAGALSGTTMAASATLYGLYSHPETVRALKHDPSLIPQAYSECQRWHTGYMTFPRFAVCDTEVGGTMIKRGMIVRVCPQAAHYDPCVYPDPQRFDIFRNAKNIAFGFGPHVCIGHHFAKQLLRIAVERLIQRLPNARLLDPEMDLEYGGALGELKIVSLPMISN